MLIKSQVSLKVLKARRGEMFVFAAQHRYALAATGLISPETAFMDSSLPQACEPVFREMRRRIQTDARR